MKPRLNQSYSQLLKIMGSDFRQTKQPKPAKKRLDSNVFFISISMSPQSLPSAKCIQLDSVVWFSWLAKVVGNV